MASSAYILKKQEEVDFDSLIHDIILAANRAELEARIDSDVHEDDYGVGVYTMGNIANTYEEIPEAQQWRMYIYSDDIHIHRFDHMVKNGHLIVVILIERISDCEQILLDFLFEYLALNPDDYFFVEEYEYDWFYNYEDIMVIKQRQFDPDWCYKDPHADK